MKIKMIAAQIGVWAMRLTWGLLDTLCGALTLLVTIPFVKKIKYHAATFVIEYNMDNGAGKWGFSLGAFIFSNSDTIFDYDEQFFCHEFGHSLPQLLVFGPLHPFVCLIPSVVRFWYRQWCIKNNYTLTPYDSFWVEGTATRWGMSWHKRAANILYEVIA